jgi:hypothetical protein
MNEAELEEAKRKRRRITIGAVVLLAGGALLSRALIKPASTITPPLAPSSPYPPTSSSSPAPAPAPAGPRALASVTVYDDGTPAADRWVVFHDEAGTVTSSMKTGKDGKASAIVASRSMITAVYGLSVQHLVTVVGVEPNDQLVIGEDEDEGGVANVVCTAMVTVRDKYPGAARHLVSLGVGQTEITDVTKPTSMPVLKRYVVDGKFRVLAEAVDASGKPIAFTHAWIDQCANQGDGGDGAVAPVVPPPAKDVRLPPWSTDYRPFSLNITSPVGDITSAPADSQVNAHAEFAIISGEDRFDRGKRDAPLLRDAGPTRISFEAPRALGAKAAYKIAIAFDGSSSSPRERSVLEEHQPEMPEQIAIDLNARMLPRVSGVVLDPPSSNPARPSLRWRLLGPMPATTKPDALVARFSWPATREHVWTFVLPPDTPPRFAVPALPDDLATYRPNAREAITASVAVFDASFFEGFAEVKKRGLGVLEEQRPETSTLRYSVSGDLDF